MKDVSIEDNEWHPLCDLDRVIDEAKAREDAFFARHGVPDDCIQSAHRAWVKAVEHEFRESKAAGVPRSCIDAPLGRKAFTLGYLAAQVPAPLEKQKGEK